MTAIICDNINRKDFQLKTEEKAQFTYPRAGTVAPARVSGELLYICEPQWCYARRTLKAGIKPGHKIDGPWAWLVCFSGALMNAIYFGIVSSFSVLLPIWNEEFKASRGTTAWIISLTIGATFLFSPITIKLINRLGERPTGIMIGLVAAGLLIASSFITNIIILYFSLGLLLGICGNIMMNIALLSPTKYFKRRLALAIGIACSGGSVGIMIFGPVVQALVDWSGWRNALRVISTTMLLVSIVSTFNDGNIEEEKEESKNGIREEEENDSSVSENKEQQPSKCFIDCTIWKSPKYTVGMISIWLSFFGLFVPTVHLISFAKDNNITGSKSSLLFTFIGVSSTVSQVVFGKIIDKRWLTPIQGVQVSQLFLGISMLLFTQAKEFQYMIPLSILFGFGNGGFGSTQTVFFLTCFGDLKKDAIGYSTAHILKAIGLFIGPPIAGAIADYFHSYIPAFYIFGGLIMFASVLPLCLVLKCTTIRPTEPAEEQSTQSRLIEVTHHDVEYCSTV